MFPTNSERLIGISDAFSAFVYGYPSSCPCANCTPNKSVTTLRYTRRHGPLYRPCLWALTECSPLDFRRSSIGAHSLLQSKHSQCKLPGVKNNNKKTVKTNFQESKNNKAQSKQTSRTQKNKAQSKQTSNSQKQQNTVKTNFQKSKEQSTVKTTSNSQKNKTKSSQNKLPQVKRTKQSKQTSTSQKSKAVKTSFRESEEQNSVNQRTKHRAKQEQILVVTVCVAVSGIFSQGNGMIPNGTLPGYGHGHNSDNNFNNIRQTVSSDNVLSMGKF